jgi:tRNA pseudouridine13 synthase
MIHEPHITPAFDERPRASFKVEPEDFVVDELEAYAPSGSGEHLYVRLEKRLWTTPLAAAQVARALGVDPRLASWAGLKDRVGLTTQTISLPWPVGRPFEEALAGFSQPGLRILGAARHGNKLKPGHLAGNRFRIRLRGLDLSSQQKVRSRLELAAREGVPNAFGAQRFGRDGDNPERALAWLAGRERGPRDKRQARLLFSALQSVLFNALLERRLTDGSWREAVPGDVAKRCDSGGLFDVPTEGPELEEARERARRFEITATGPMYGASMRWPSGEARRLEEAVLAERGLGAEAFRPFAKLGEGTRRPLRIAVSELSIEASDDGLVLGFVLPKGSYATTLLELACQLDEPSRGPQNPAQASPGAGPDVTLVEPDLDEGSTSDG